MLQQWQYIRAHYWNNYHKTFFRYATMPMMKMAEKWGVDPHTLSGTHSFQDWILGRQDYLSINKARNNASEQGILYL